jgi:uncharacterized protein YbgA (DUF1722 family)
LTAACPLLPVEEEGRLHDPRLRENFVERLFAFHRLRRFFAGPWRRGDLVNFHTAEKFLLLAHDRTAYEELGRLVARGKSLPAGELAARYQAGYMRAMAKPATPKRHADVLQHMAGYLKEALGPDDKKELAGVIDDYRRGLLPLVVPVTLLRHHIRAHGGARAVPSDKPGLPLARTVPSDKPGLPLARTVPSDPPIRDGGLGSRPGKPGLPLARAVPSNKPGLPLARAVAYLEGQRYLDPHPKELMLRNHV